jgi:hypothetical protein
MVGVLTRGAALMQASPKPQPAQEAKPQSADARRSPEKEETIELGGRVLDPEGKPVAGAKLHLPRLRADPSSLPGEEIVTQRGITGADGRFKLTLPKKEAQPEGNKPATLIAAAAGFGIDWMELPKEGTPVGLTLRLVKDVPVRGRLVSMEARLVVRCFSGDSPVPTLRSRPARIRKSQKPTLLAGISE